MTKQEFAQIQMGICVAYPKAKILETDQAMDFWYEMIGDLDYQVVNNAVLEHISTSVFPPSIAEIRQKCTQRLNPIITDWGAAWEEVQNAMRRYGYYREEEAMASLSSLTAVAVRRMGFRNLCMSENPVADRAHFQRMYEGMVKEEQNRVQLPWSVREQKQRMIESSLPPVEAIEQKDVEGIPERIESSGMSTYVSDLLKGFKRKMHVPEE